MLVDEYEQYPNEKTDVVVVSRSGSDEPEPTLSATDRMFSFILPPPGAAEVRATARPISVGCKSRKTTEIGASSAQI
jgi:hypothetical protein